MLFPRDPLFLWLQLTDFRMIRDQTRSKVAATGRVLFRGRTAIITVLRRPLPTAVGY